MRILVPAIALSIALCATIAGGTVIWRLTAVSPEPTLETIRALLDAHDTVAAVEATARIPRLDIDNAATGAVLDELYGNIRDAATDEPATHFANGDTRRIARQLLEATQERRKTDMNRDRRAGEFALAAGLNGEAVDMLRRAGSADIASAPVLAPLAIALFRSGLFAEVLTVARPEEGTTAHQRCVLWTLRGRAHEGLRQYDDARLSLRAAFAEEPANLKVMFRLGLVELAHGYRGEARALLDRARVAAPGATPTLRLAAEYAYVTGDYTASAVEYGKLIGRNDTEDYDPLPASLGKARALIYAGDVRAAEIALGGAGALLPHDDFVQYYRALLAYRSGNYRKAIEVAQPLEARMKAYPPLNLLIGAASLADGYPQIAARQLLRYLDVESSNSAARALLNAAEDGIGNPGKQPTMPSELLLRAFSFPL